MNLKIHQIAKFYMSKNFRISSADFFGFVFDRLVFLVLCATSNSCSISTLLHFLSERRSSDSEYRLTAAT